MCFQGFLSRFATGEVHRMMVSEASTAVNIVKRTNCSICRNKNDNFSTIWQPLDTNYDYGLINFLKTLQMIYIKPTKLEKIGFCFFDKELLFAFLSFIVWKPQKHSWKMSKTRN